MGEIVTRGKADLKAERAATRVEEETITNLPSDQPPRYSAEFGPAVNALDADRNPDERAQGTQIPGVLGVDAANDIINNANLSGAEQARAETEVNAVAAGKKKGFKAATGRTFEKIGSSMPGSKGWSKKKKRTVGAMVMLGGLGLVAGGIGLAVWAAVESGSRNETEREMDMIKAEEGYTLETDAYQQMLQDDVNRLSADGYTVSVTRDDAGNIVAYSATQEGFADITFEDNEYLRTMIENAMQEQKEAEAQQEVAFE